MQLVHINSRSSSLAGKQNHWEEEGRDISEDSLNTHDIRKGSSLSSDRDNDISRTKRDSDLGQQRTVCNFYIILNLYFIRGFTLIQFVPLPIFQCLKKISEDQDGGF